MKINYPIKYAAMPIIEQVGWSHGLNELEREYDVVCYIVSICYLLNDSTKYKENGESIKEYEVVFPYQLHGQYSIWERTTPSFNLFSGNCTNSSNVDVIFDSYEEALKYVATKNEELCDKCYDYLPYSDDLIEKIKEKIKEFNDRLSKYKILEQQIHIQTSDLLNNKRKKLNKVIRFKNNKIDVLSCDLYETIRLFDNTKFVVYTVTPEQYDKLVELSHKEVNDISSIIGHTEGLLVHNSKDCPIRIVNKNILGVYYIGEDKLLHFSDEIKKVTEDELLNIDADTDILYTTENVSDIINSYQRYTDIDLVKEQEAVLRREKK